LIEGVPGTAKTLTVKTLSRIINAGFGRIQFTPDLMPSDITGTSVLEEDENGRRSFRFVEGPIFTNILLADEINRTPPKTQAALLQAMQEREVTAGQSTYQLPNPFFTIATQNPIEQEGTYPLPEAQLDRFMLNLWLDYPSEREEIDIVKATTGDYSATLEKVMTGKEICDYQALVRSVPVADNVVEFAVKLVGRTRNGRSTAPDFVNKFVSYGAGPRASQYLVLGAKVRALLQGRYTPSIDDIRALAMPVLRHRVIVNFNAEAEGMSSVDIIERLIKE
jgi:MoxR-like ATPase